MSPLLHHHHEQPREPALEPRAELKGTVTRLSVHLADGAFLPALREISPHGLATLDSVEVVAPVAALVQASSTSHTTRVPPGT